MGSLPLRSFSEMQRKISDQTPFEVSLSGNVEPVVGMISFSQNDKTSLLTKQIFTA